NDATDDPAPSLHPHRAQQGLHRYYEPVRRRAPDRYSAPREFSPLGTLPLAPERQYRGTPSHVPCESSRPGSRRLRAGYHPANQRAPAGLIPGHPTNAPVSISPRSCYRHLNSDLILETAHRLPGRHPTHLVRLSGVAHHDRLQPTQHAAAWSLPPQGDSERANLHLSHSTTSRNPAYINQPPLCVRGTSGVPKLASWLQIPDFLGRAPSFGTPHGTAEASLTAGLVAMGVVDSTAFAIAFTHRLCTYYLRPIWGYFSMR